MAESIDNGRVWQGSTDIALRERDDQCYPYLFSQI